MHTLLVSMEDIMSAMLGGGFGGFEGLGGSGRRRARKGKDVGLAVPATLADFYNGAQRAVPFERAALCGDCGGSGARGGTGGGACPDCRGRGVRVRMQQVGPGMVQQTQAQCDKCGGQGIAVAEADKCKTCKMKRVKVEKTSLKIKIEKGMAHEQKIPFPGMGDEHPDIETPGSVIAILQQEKHDVFTRDGDDLKITQNLKLSEALCGFEIKIKQLDGRILLVKNKPGEIIQHKDIKSVIGEGMPIYKGNGKKGNLVIEFNVQFPFTMDDDQIELLQNALPVPPPNTFSYNRAEAEQASITPAPIDEIRKEMENIAAEEEDEDTGGSNNVRCAQQ